MRLELFLLRLYKLMRVVQSPRLLRALLKYRVLAGVEHKPILSPTLSTVVDIGANRGQFAFAVREYAPNAQIIAFEPLAKAAARFRDVFDGDGRVTLHQVAIGPENGDAVIHVSKQDDSSSLLPISSLQVQLFPGTGETAKETIRVARLEDFVNVHEIRLPAMLKLDVQGFELEALRGCEDLLERFSYVYAECSFVELYTGQALAHEVIDWLARHCFILTGLYNISYDKNGKAIQGDFLFTNTKGCDEN